MGESSVWQKERHGSGEDTTGILWEGGETVVIIPKAAATTSVATTAGAATLQEQQQQQQSVIQIEDHREEEMETLSELATATSLEFKQITK